MTARVVVAAAAMLACAGAAVMAAPETTSPLRGHFDTQWANEETYIKQHVHSLAEYLEGQICYGCDWTTPAHQDNKTIDKGIVFNAGLHDIDDVSPLSQLASDVGDGVRDHYIDLVSGKLEDGDREANAMWSDIMTDNFNDLTLLFKRFYDNVRGAWPAGSTSRPLLAGASTNGGGGFGFGITISCNGTVLLTVGGGVGFGYTGAAGNMTGGGGGGGGMQAFVGGQQVWSTGGGGGGGIAMTANEKYNPSWGTQSDAGQQITHGVFSKIAAIAGPCHRAGGLLSQVSAGGGMGVQVNSPEVPAPATPTTTTGPGPTTSTSRPTTGTTKPTTDPPAGAAGEEEGEVEGDGPEVGDDPSGGVVLRYGGGYGFSWQKASPNGAPTPPPAGQTSVFGQVATACRNRCLRNTRFGQFYNCLCPCVKSGFSQTPLGKPWAHLINCQVPSPEP